MRILFVFVTLFLASIAAQTFAPIETGMPGVAKKACDKACYNTYRYLIGDYHTNEDWVDHASSHQSSAEEVCAAELCSDCPFCNVNQSEIDYISNARMNLLARTAAQEDRLASCLDCQKSVDICQASLKDTITDGLDCELKVCTTGPLHCRIGGQCERRICKDLGACTRKVPPSHHECRSCTRQWLYCLHALCLPPTQDCFTLQCPAPNPTCSAYCWRKDLRGCRPGTLCHHPVFADNEIDFGSLGVTQAIAESANQSLECIGFRADCVATCDLQKLRSTCKSTCDSKWRVSNTKKKLCKSDCNQKVSCEQHCKEKTCCMGPEHCRVGGNHYRCGDVADMECTVWRKEDLESRI